jgi:hypothetical protein
MEENPSILNYYNPVATLLRRVMRSTYTFPQRYKINHIRYDPVPLVEGDFGKVYKGQDLDICVSLVTRSRDVSVRFPKNMSMVQR